VGREDQQEGLTIVPVQVKEMTAQTQPAGAGVDCFLSLKTKRAGKIKGESTTSGHEDDIELFGFTWGVASATALGSGQATARRQYRPLVISKGIDSSSTGLASALSTNDEVKEAVLTLRKSGGAALDYVTIKVSNGRVTDIAIDVDASGVPVEKVTLVYTVIDIEYKRQQSTGGSAGSSSFHDEVLPQ
jgi:type VI secretion system secreted protein Hcp